jgi:uncharacterized protein YkwD
LALTLDTLDQENLDLENQGDTKTKADTFQNDDQLEASTPVEDPSAMEMTGEEGADTGDTSTSTPVEDTSAMEMTGEEGADTGDTSTSTPVEDPSAMEMTGEEGAGTGDASTLADSDAFDQQILDLVNQERAKVGADPLSINEQLDQAADLHSQDQASMDNMTHIGSNGSNLGGRIQDQGYQFSTAGENVSQVALDADTVMFGGQGFENIGITGWMESSGHRENILNPDFEEIGIGFSTAEDGSPYWTQNFGAEMA